MTKFIGPQYSIGIGRETTRGTPIAATYWQPWASLSIDDMVKSAKDETSVGVIESGVGQEATMFTSKGSLEGNIDDQGFGLIMKALMGTETKSTVETGVDDHKFTMQENAQHPSLSFSVYGPNESTGRVYPLGMIESLDLDFELNKYATYKMAFTCNGSTTQANTVSFSASLNKLRPQDMTFGYASTLSGLSGPTAVAIKKFSLSFKKNTEDDEVLGATAPVDRLNKAFACTGSFELYYTDRTFIDTIMVGDLYKALQIVVSNTSVLIGTASHPTLTVNLAKVKLTEVSRKFSAKDVATQTVKFTAFMSLGDSEMLDMTLRNTIVTTY